MSDVESEISNDDESSMTSELPESDVVEETEQEVLENEELMEEIEGEPFWIDDIELEDNQSQTSEPTESENKTVQKSTKEYMTKYEFTKLIGVRAEQIMNGSQVFVNPRGIDDSILLAVMELKENKIPLKIRRQVPDKNSFKVEDWSTNEFKNIDILLRFYNYNLYDLDE
jgi:DNA-directed RNA polymerase subunit K/omega